MQFASLEFILAAAPQPVWLDVPAHADAGTSIDWRWRVFLFLILCAAAATCLTWVMRRHSLAQMDPAEFAFRKLSFRLRLASHARQSIRELAAASGIPAVALLISEDAFDRAASASAASKFLASRGMQASSQFASLRNRLFARS